MTKAITLGSKYSQRVLQKNLIIIFLIITFQGLGAVVLNKNQLAAAPVSAIYDSIYKWKFYDSIQSWSLVARIIEMHYDSNKNLLSCIKQKKEDNSWVNEFKESYTYDVNNNKIGYFRSIWGGTKWYDDTRITYSYTGNKLMASVPERWVESSNYWYYEIKTIYTYDGNGNELTKEEQSFNNGTWLGFLRYTTTYTSGKKIEKVLWEKTFGNTTWKNYRQHLYSYDTNGNLIEDLNQHYNFNQVWESEFRTTHAYNNTNTKTLYQFEQRNINTGQWYDPLTHYSYKWDANNNIIYYKINTNEHYSAIYNSMNQLTDQVRHFGFNENSGENVYETDSTHYFIHEESNGIADQKAFKNNAFIYPNPSDGIFTIQLENNRQAKTVDVYNVIGESILHQTLSNEINISNVQPGIYFVKIDDGIDFYTHKITIQ